MTDLKQLQEDSCASAFRRFPNTASNGVAQKIFEECEELQAAFLAEWNCNHYLSPHCPSLTAVEEEWADVLFALLVFAKLENIDIEKALRIKNEFNKVRL